MANVHSVPFGKQKQDLSTGEWRKIWLEKLKKASEARKLNKTTSIGFLDFTNRYLSMHSGHPGERSLLANLNLKKDADEHKASDIFESPDLGKNRIQTFFIQ